MMLRPDRSLLILAFVLFVTVATLVWVCAEGSRALLYGAVFLMALVPGLPLGFALFGRRHAAGWIAGSLLGYALTALAWSVAIHLGARMWIAFVLASGVLLAGTVGLRKRLAVPLIQLPHWSRRDTVALLFVLLLVPALMWLPYAHNGAPDATGTRYYRAYFTADFLWHMAVTGELSRFSLPPMNPFFAGETMHYYWTYFIVPAVGSALLGAGRHLVEQSLEINAVLSGLLFVAAIFMAVWTAVPRGVAAAAGVMLGFVAASAQGWYGIYYYLYERGRSIAYLREVNIGALTNWILQGLRIDGLPRSLWWTPQHAAACALGLIAVTAVCAGPATMTVGGILIVGVSLAAALVFSPLLGGSFAIIYGVSVLVHALRAQIGAARMLRVLVRHALAAIPVAVALIWCQLNQMFEGAGTALAFGLGGLAARAPVETLLLALGPLLALAVMGVLWPRFPMSSIPHLIGALLGLFLLYYVRLLPDLAWVGFRAGQILQITLSGLAAVAVARLLSADGVLKGLGLAFVGGLLLAGLPTTIVDVYNAQDTANRRMGPGFRWTIDITPAQQAGFDWMKHSLPLEAVVQMEATVRGRETWSLLPTFAQRRMAAGNAIPLLHDPAHDRLVRRVRDIYELPDAGQAAAIARDLRIDYVYLDRVERQRYPRGSAKFDASPHFMRVYRNEEVLIYAVQR